MIIPVRSEIVRLAHQGWGYSFVKFEKNKENFIEGLEEEETIQLNAKFARNVYEGFVKYHEVMVSLGIQAYYNNKMDNKEKENE